VGDLALFHDLNALWLAARQPLVIVVVNNAGGAIFGQLAQAGLPEFRALWTTPTALDAGAAAALFGLPFARHDTAAPLIADILRHLADGAPALLELAVDAGASAAARRAWWRSCADAVDCAAPL
jgi:2-succinyl-5-enolpyruvyl-6-hydroxy-3-cyclohexene-1-carboxylate synthase